MNTFEQTMLEAGVIYNYNRVLQRFMNNEALLVKFIKKFVDDPSYQQAMDAYSGHDYKGLELSAHTLKGVSANLGFDDLSAGCKEIVDLIRQTQYEPEDDTMEKLVAKLTDDYMKVVKAIKNLD